MGEKQFFIELAMQWFYAGFESFPSGKNCDKRLNGVMSIFHLTEIFLKTLYVSGCDFFNYLYCLNGIKNATNARMKKAKNIR